MYQANQWIFLHLATTPVREPKVTRELTGVIGQNPKLRRRQTVAIGAI